MTSPTPSLARVVRTAVDARLRDVHVGMPGRVVAYDAARQCADVQPLVRRPYRDEGGETDYETLAVITDVPVVFEGGGGYGFVYPLEAGDDVWLSFASCELGAWAATGGLTDAADARRCSLSDAVCYPGLRDLVHPRESAPTDHARIGADGGVAIEFRTTDIRIGGGAGHETTIKADTYRTAEDLLFTAIAALGTALAAPAAAAIGGAAQSAAGAVATAVSTFQAAAAAYKTTIAKVK